MANFERSGLYVVIKNVEQLKKTFATINALKGGKEITMHFETITVNKETNEKINVLKINENGINESVGITIQHELYSDPDKYKCIDDKSTHRIYSNICVDSKTLYDIFKGLNNNYTVIFYVYLNESSLRINITCNSFLQDLKIPTIDIPFSETNMNKYSFDCCVMMNTKTLNDNIKLYNKIIDDLTIRCTNKSLTFKTYSTSPNSIESTTTLQKGTNQDDIIIFPNEKIQDSESMIIKSTYPMKCLMLVSRIDEQFCEKVTLMFIKTKIGKNYAIIFNYSYDKNEFIKIIVLPKNITTNNDENSEQINY